MHQRPDLCFDNNRIVASFDKRGAGVVQNIVTNGQFVGAGKILKIGYDLDRKDQFEQGRVVGGKINVAAADRFDAVMRIRAHVVAGIKHVVAKDAKAFF